MLRGVSLRLPGPRRRATLAACAAALAGGASATAAAAALPARPAVLKVTPGAGDTRGTFTIRVPGRLFREIGPRSDSELSIWFTYRSPAGTSPWACTPYELPRPRITGTGSRRRAVFTVPARLLSEHGGRWCAGRYRADISIRRPFTFCDAEGGCGGSEQKIATSAFTVRAR